MNNKLQLFKDEPGFLKLFLLFKEKYRSLGRIGGNVSLKMFDLVELESIAGFLGQSSERLRQKGSIALLDFEKELANTGFIEYSLLSLLEAVLQEPIFTKKEEQEQEQKKEQMFIDALILAIPEGEWWFRWIQSKTSDTKLIWTLYKQNQDELFDKLVTVFRAFSSLPKEGEFERLPFFSQRVTGNPHYFDNQEIAGRLLIQCMYVEQVLGGNSDLVMPRNVEELNDLLAEYGIMRDDLWNFVTCQGLLASKQNIIHPVWQAAIQMQTVLNVPMKELAKIDRIWPCIGSNVYIIENSSVASTVMDALPNDPIICTHGQLRMASWRLLDFLIQANCTLYYSGDIDPEGLVIAERVKKRYGDQVVFWRMDPESYNTSISNEDISDRLSKLDNISSPEWKDIISLMKEKKKAGYQEAIVYQLISDIERNEVEDGQVP